MMLGPKGGLVSIDGREVILVALVAVCNNGFECTNEPWRLQMAFGTWCGGHTGVFITLGLTFVILFITVTLLLLLLLLLSYTRTICLSIILFQYYPPLQVCIRDLGSGAGSAGKCGLAACCVGIDGTGTGSTVGATTGGKNGLLAKPRELSWD